ncbi:hypothetical protein SDC9_201577 [bioreactor metagenome]|uniref:Flagellar operon protein n=1 Tax=bioreactor metagenome TaxID=1076179 RepID=A0A645IRC5_9ZZZZ
MTQRDIELSQDDLEKLTCAVSKAGQKGVANTLVLCDKGAFIINVPSQTVITALSGSDVKDNIFTQIDGAVIL